MNFLYLIVPLLTNLSIILHPYLGTEFLSFEYILRIYFSMFTSFFYIMNLILAMTGFISLIHKNILFLNLISMFNFINGNSFIPKITNDNNINMINDIIFCIFTTANILSIVYLFENRYYHPETYFYNPKIEYIDDNMSDYYSDYSEDKINTSDSDESDSDKSNHDSIESDSNYTYIENDEKNNKKTD